VTRRVVGTGVDGGSDVLKGGVEATVETLTGSRVGAARRNGSTASAGSGRGSSMDARLTVLGEETA
jgi:hypothetical protein